MTASLTTSVFNSPSTSDAFLNTDPLKEVAFQSLKGEQPWSTRRIRVASHILEEGAVLAGQFLPSLTKLRKLKCVPTNIWIAFQEALFRQVIDLAELLGDGWAWESSDWQLLDFTVILNHFTGRRRS
jgi:hypothetical protein